MHHRPLFYLLLITITFLGCRDAVSLKNTVTLEELYLFKDNNSFESLKQRYRQNPSQFLDRSKEEMRSISGWFNEAPEIREEILRKTLKSYPDEINTRLQLAYLEIENENYSKGIEHLEKFCLQVTGYSSICSPFDTSGYVPTKLPLEDSLLFKSNNNWDADTAIVYIQDGIDNPYRYNVLADLSNQENLIGIYPKPAHYLNPSIINSTRELTEEEAEFEIQNSVEILRRTIDFLVKENKSVNLVCAWEGASICKEYLAQDVAPVNQVFLMGNTLNYPDFAELNSKLDVGEVTQWSYDIPQESDKELPPLQLKPKQVKYWSWPESFPMMDAYNLVLSNRLKLTEVTDKKNYLELIKAENWGKMTMVNSEIDRYVRPVTDNEKSFLKNKGIDFLEVNHTLNFTRFLNKVWQSIRNNEPLHIAEHLSAFPEAEEFVLDKIKNDKTIEKETGGIIEIYNRPLVSGITQPMNDQNRYAILNYSYWITGQNKNIEATGTMTNHGEEWKMIDFKTREIDFTIPRNDDGKN